MASVLGIRGTRAQLELVTALLYLLPLLSARRALALTHMANSSAASAIFMFGDSTVDPGNNNYIATVVKSDFPPYGRDFPGGQPTGRFSDGKLATDFIASQLGVKDEVPPYLDESLSEAELMTGVSFASAGTGFDPLTAQISGVIPIPQQLGYFREYLARLDVVVGKKRREDIVGRAVFVVSAGTNDFVVNYFALPFRRHEFGLGDYESFLLQNLRQLLQGLVGLGARRIGVVGLPPMGCLPLVITLDPSGGPFHRGCVDEYDVVTREYNAKLQAELRNGISPPGTANILYADIYNPAMQLIRHPEQFGFDETSRGCCGTGLLEAAILCNPKTAACADPSKYVFWDSVHPTQRANFIVASHLHPTFARLLLQT